MVSDNQSIQPDDGDKAQVTAYMTDDERRVVGLAAVESAISRAAFISAAAVAAAVAVLREKNPSALDGTPFSELAKSA